MLSGLDNVIDSYIEASKRFVGTYPTDLSIKDGYYVFMRSVLNDIREGLYKVRMSNSCFSFNIQEGVLTRDSMHVGC